MNRVSNVRISSAHRRRRLALSGCWGSGESEGKRISEISPQRAAFPLRAVRTFLAHHANMSSEIGREGISFWHWQSPLPLTSSEVLARACYSSSMPLRWGSLLFSPNQMWWVASQLVFLTFLALHHQTQNFFFVLRFCIMSLREGN